jgi:hypothetical protein
LEIAVSFDVGCVPKLAEKEFATISTCAILSRRIRCRDNTLIAPPDLISPLA